MNSRLSIIATPIGNLGDLSPRAIKTLKESEIIFAESANYSRSLLNLIGVNLKEVKLIDCPAIKEESKIKLLLDFLEQNKKISLITDAGAPNISDPGNKLIIAAIDSKYPIEVIPGPSAVIAALMGAGLVTHKFVFLGFLPKKGKERERLILESLKLDLALVIFESPHRIKKTLEKLFYLLGETKIVIARELTKKFETFHRGLLGQNLEPELVEKGEMVIIIEPTKQPSPDFDQSKSSSPASERRLIGHKALAKKIALEHNISVKEAYKKLLDS